MVFIDSLPDKWSDLKGHCAVMFLPSVSRKNDKCSLANTELVDELEMMVVEPPLGTDEWSTYAMIMWWMKNGLPDDWKDLFFLRPAPLATMKKRRKEAKETGSKLFFADVRMVKVPNQGTRNAMKPHGKMGKNTCNTNAKWIANRCNFKNADSFKARSARRGGLSLMVNKGVNDKVIQQSGRHSRQTTALLYQDPEQKKKNTAYTSMFYNASMFHSFCFVFCFNYFSLSFLFYRC